MNGGDRPPSPGGENGRTSTIPPRETPITRNADQQSPDTHDHHDRAREHYAAVRPAAPVAPAPMISSQPLPRAHGVPMALRPVAPRQLAPSPLNY
jgi:hypothetical protein